MKTIYFDMDGTIADLYGQSNWLEDIRAERPCPYSNAQPLVNMQELTNICIQLQKYGYGIGIITWLSKESSASYKAVVRQAKKEWLQEYFPIDFNSVHMVQYGYSKRQAGGRAGDILFDDEQGNILGWSGKKNDRQSYLPKDIFKVLYKLLAQYE